MVSYATALGNIFNLFIEKLKELVVVLFIHLLFIKSNFTDATQRHLNLKNIKHVLFRIIYLMTMAYLNNYYKIHYFLYLTINKYSIFVPILVPIYQIFLIFFYTYNLTLSKHFYNSKLRRFPEIKSKEKNPPK